MPEPLPSEPLSRRALLRHLTASTVASALPQTNNPRTLIEVLPAVRWNPASQGMLLAVAPEQTPRLRNRKSAPAPLLPPAAPDGHRSLTASLPAFGRRLFASGTVAVIAPETMQVIASEPPAGALALGGLLSPDDRILYLLSTLTTGQWQRLGSEKGLGIVDLSTRDQKNAFLEILPDPLTTARYKVGQNGTLDRQKNSARTLSPAERSQVRLRIDRVVGFAIPLLNEPPGSYSGGGLPEYGGEPGTLVTAYDDRAQLNRGDALGVNWRQTLPNKPRPSDLDYAHSTLDTLVSVANGDTIGTLVSRIGKAVGQELFADFRVAALPLFVRGVQARAGDLLRALALGVAGTWRKVDEKAFVLAADRIGAGTRSLRLALWKTDQERRAQQAVVEWQKAIARSGHVKRSLNYAADNPLLPSPEVLRKAESLTEKNEEHSKAGRIPVSDLPPAARPYLQQRFTQYSHQSSEWDPTAVYVEPRFGARLVLPEGTVLPTHLDVGGLDFLATATGDEADVQDKPMVVPPELRGPFALNLLASRCGLLASSATAEAGIEAVRLARAFGFDTVLLRTEDPVILEAAVRAGKEGSPSIPSIGVCAVTQPVFAASTDTPSEVADRNLLGESAPDAFTVRAASPQWRIDRKSAYLALGPRPDISWLDGFSGAIAAPSPDGTPLSRTRILQSCARVSRLAGIFFGNPIPSGYAGGRMDAQNGQDVGTMERMSLGYAARLRLAFLRKESIDPMDLIPKHLHFPADLRQAFFLDDNARGERTTYDGTESTVEGFDEKLDRWNVFRVAENRAALAALVREVQKVAPHLPLWFQTTAPDDDGQAQARCFAQPTYRLWTDAKTPLVGPSSFDRSRRTPAAANTLLHTIRLSRHGETKNRRESDIIGDGDWLAYVFYQVNHTPAPSPFANSTVLLDLSNFPPEEARVLLGAWIKKPESPPTVPASR